MAPAGLVSRGHGSACDCSSCAQGGCQTTSDKSDALSYRRSYLLPAPQPGIFMFMTTQLKTVFTDCVVVHFELDN